MDTKQEDEDKKKEEKKKFLQILFSDNIPSVSSKILLENSCFSNLIRVLVRVLESSTKSQKRNEYSIWATMNLGLTDGSNIILLVTS
jgi:hypothetical protein